MIAFFEGDGFWYSRIGGLHVRVYDRGKNFLSAHFRAHCPRTNAVSAFSFRGVRTLEDVGILFAAEYRHYFDPGGIYG